MSILWVCSQEYYCWILKKIHPQFSEELTYCIPKWLCKFALPTAVEYYCSSTSFPISTVISIFVMVILIIVTWHLRSITCLFCYIDLGSHYQDHLSTLKRLSNQLHNYWLLLRCECPYFTFMDNLP